MSNDWKSKPQEIKNLFSPPFCGFILATCISSFNKESGTKMPIPLAFLILPLVLHKKTRELLPRSKSSNFRLWAIENLPVLINFHLRVKSLNQYTLIALNQLLINRRIEISDGAIGSHGAFRGQSAYLHLEEELDEIHSKAIFLGKWLAEYGQTASIYTSLGVRP
jgi:hypothetical protein